VKDIELIGANQGVILLRMLMAALGAFSMLMLLSIVDSNASSKEMVVFGLVSLLPLFLVLLPAAKGLLTWPIEISINAEGEVLSLRSVFGRAISIPFHAVREMQPTSFWHGGRTSFDGLVLHLNYGERICLSKGNIRSIQEVQDALARAGVPLTRRTSTGRALNP
jgi:hypothetical protein